MTDSIRLSDIIARSVTVEWFEAVALVREVTERIVEQPGAYSVPELHQIDVRGDGHVLVNGGTGTDEPVRRLGQLLQALLAQATPPVQLRLAVSQATAPVPAFGTVSEFYDALGYFERPDRIEVLRGLHARVAGMPGPAQVIPLPTVDALAPLPEPEPEPQQQIRRSRKNVAWVVVAAAFLSIAGALAYLRWGPQLKAEQVSGAALKATDAVGNAVVSGISSVSERAGLGRLAPKDSSSVPAAPALVAAADTAATAGRRPAASRKAVVPQVAYDLDPVPAAPEPVNTPAMEKLRGMLASMSSKPPAASAEPAAKRQVPDPTVYQTGAAGVVPPVGVRPQLPRDLPSNVNKDQLAQIELVVLPDGTVGSVKLLGHRNVHDAMFLSAVKAWEFKPALKDGQPVMYRKIVWMAFQ